MKKYTLTLLLSTAPLFAGVSAPMSAPAPQSDCAAGWTLGLEALALRTYASGGGSDQSGSNYDFGGRVSLGYQFSDCLFTKVTYFGYKSDGIYGYNNDDPAKDYVSNGSTDLDVSYLDWVVGQHFKPSEKLTLSPYAGLRWGMFKLSGDYHFDSGNPSGGYDGTYKADFSGLGIVVGLDATRALANNFSLYGTAKQSILFGSTDYSSRQIGFGSYGVNNNSSSQDVVVSVSELSFGVQYDYAFSNVAANVRLGVEAQYYAGGGGGEMNGNIGLAGFVLGANFH